VSASLARLFRAAAVAASAVAIAALCLLCAVTVVDVTGRYLFNSPQLGAVEMGEFLMVVLTFGGLALAELRGGHIDVDFFVGSLPARARVLLEAGAALLGSAFWGFVAWRAALHAGSIYEAGEVSPNLALPTWPFYLTVTVGCGLFAIALLGRVLRALRPESG
jgi:TRAP-type C4-dicarboxylate transport system permease small subunit